MTDIKKREIKGRVRYVLYGVCIVFLVIVVKLAYLAFMGYKKDFSSYILKTKRVVRRDIVDRSGNVLAINVPSSSVYLRPRDIKDKARAVEALSVVLGISRVVAEGMVDSRANFLWVKRNITEEEVLELKYYGVIGINFERETKRFYPYGSLFAQVVGITDIDGKGISGVESYFNDNLYENNLELSLDVRIQMILYDALRKGMEDNKAKGAYGMVIDPNTSEVLAMVSLPDFDPNYREDMDIGALFNYPTQGLLEQGSIAKVFSVAMALENGGHVVEDRYDVSKPIVNRSYIIVDFDYMDRELIVPEILMYSSNIGTSILMKEIGVANQIRYLNRFNLFRETYLEVLEKEESLTQYKWNDLTSMTVSYGYGLAMSQATFMNAFGTIINGGNFIPLTLLRVRDTSKVVGSRVVSEGVSYEMRRMLRLTVAKGTGKRGDVVGYSVGGKTGSAEKQVGGKYNKDKVIASFLGFFPSNMPRYAVIVTINEPKRLAVNGYNITGGSLSAPIAHEIISKIATVSSLERVEDDTRGVDKSSHKSIIEYVKYVEGR